MPLQFGTAIVPGASRGVGVQTQTALLASVALVRRLQCLVVHDVGPLCDFRGVLQLVREHDRQLVLMPADGFAEADREPETGNNLYFRRGNQILVTTVSVERGMLRSSPERIVASGEFSPAQAGDPMFDVMPDGSLIVLEDEIGPPRELRVVVNWAASVLRQTK